MADRDINSVTEMATMDTNDKIFVSDNGSALKKVDIDDMAQFIMENYIKINMNYENS